MDFSTHVTALSTCAKIWTGDVLLWLLLPFGSGLDLASFPVFLLQFAFGIIHGAEELLHV